MFLCQNWDISQDIEGIEVSPEDLAAMMLDLQNRGCHNINLITPEHVVPQILEALPLAVQIGLRLLWFIIRVPTTRWRVCR